MNRVVARWWDPGEFCVPFALFCGFQMFPHKEALGLWWGWRPSSSGVAGERHVSPGRRPCRAVQAEPQAWPRGPEADLFLFPAFPALTPRGPCRPVQGCLPGRAGPGDSRRPREHARHCEPSGAEPAPRPSGPAPPGQCSPAPKRPGPRAGQPEATPQPQSLELPSPGAPLRPPPPRPLLQNHGGGRGCFPPTAPPPPAACPGSPKPCVGGCAPASGDV